MPRKAQGLTAAKVQKAKPGRYGDGGGLYLCVRDCEHKYWLFRWVRGGKMREMGLGPTCGNKAVSLAAARQKARELNAILREGLDPLAEKQADKVRKAETAAREAARAVTFAQAAERFLTEKEQGWKNPIHRQQWRNTLRDYVLPQIGYLPVSQIDTDAISRILKPLWTTKLETAGRLRGRIEKILDFARVSGWREGENPARWKGHFEYLLPKPSSLRKANSELAVKHHAALDWREIGAFMEALRSHTTVSAKCLEFLILTAARSGEARGAVWAEIDLSQGIWTIPAERMKAHKQHKVPLSEPALAALEKMAELRISDDLSALIFPGGKLDGRPLSDVALSKTIRACGYAGATVHGFRSTFRDWVSEHTNFQTQIAEFALAHGLSDKTEAAYARGDLFVKRRKLMDAWAEFCGQPFVSAEVVTLKRLEANVR